VVENYAPNVYHENSVHRMYRDSDHVPRVENGVKRYDQIIDNRGLFGLSYDNSIGASFYPANPFAEIVTVNSAISRRNTIANMFPNWAITVLNNYARMTIILPLSVDCCSEMIATFYLDDAAANAEFYEARVTAANGGVIARLEDNRICESVQRGRGSRHFSQLPYNAFWDAPHYAFSNLLTNRLLEQLEENQA
jgi:hypothetical protein